MLAQLIYAFKGFPEKATNQKKRLFNEYYTSIFEEDFDVDSCKKIYELYRDIQKNFENSNIKIELSEMFYIIYVISKKYNNFCDLSAKGISNISMRYVEKIYNFIKHSAEKFTELNENKFAVSRAFIKRDFKEQIDKELEELL